MESFAGVESPKYGSLTFGHSVVSDDALYPVG